MRQETQPWNKIELVLELIDLGVGLTGKTPTALLKRQSDGKWLQSGGTWGASPSSLTLTEVDATNFPGLYRFQPGSSDLTYDDGVGGYLAKILETTQSVDENVLITVSTQRADIRDIDLTAPASLTDGTLGELLARMVGLRGHFERIVFDTFSGTIPTHGKIYLYESAAQRIADTGPAWAGAYGSYEFTATVSTGAVTEYDSDKVT